MADIGRSEVDYGIETREPAVGLGGRVPPQAIEVEQAVLGAMLIEKEAVPKALEVLDQESFYRDAHAKIFQAMASLFDKSEPIDVTTVSEELRRRGHLEAIGGAYYLTELTMKVTSAANVESHAYIVLEKAILRRLIEASSDIAQRSYSPAEDPLELLDEAEQKIFRIAERRLKKSSLSLSKAVAETFEMLERIHGQRGGVIGVPSGFTYLDNLTGGFQQSDLIIIAGRPSQGKTALALSIARNAAVEHGVPIGIFSLEMASQQLVLRLLAAEARVNAHALRTGRLSDEEWPKLSTKCHRLAESKMFIDDTPALGILELRAKARRLKAEHNIGVVIVDYLQLMQGPRDAENREKEISMISRSLKALAKELTTPVIALSQLSRAVEARSGRRPVLSDLRECVTGDTLVLLADGRSVPISKLEDQKPAVLTVTREGRIIERGSDKIWRVGKKPILRIRLASGRSIRATANHRLYCINGWQEVANLRAGQRLAIARSLPEPRNSDEAWPEERLILLAHLIGDGSYLQGQPLRYTTSSEENSKAVEFAARDQFESEVKHYKGRRSWHQLLLSGNGNRWHPSGVNLWLRELDVFNQRSYEKRVPEAVFRLKNQQVALFLRHLWATDGCIHCRKNGSSVVYYATNSRRLADDVALLLLRFGLVARIKTTKKAQYRPNYQVVLTDVDAHRIFLGTIGAFGPRKPQAELLSRHLDTIVTNTNVDTIPQEIFSLVRTRMKDQGVSQRRMAALRGTEYGGSAHFKFAPSRRTLLEYAEILNDATLKGLATNDLYWDTIISIQDDGEEDVYDLTVPETAAWLANGIVSHNSGAIEQDADVVIFVHRPEIYGERFLEDGQTPSEGLAEIIVGKQRNGPTGKILLSFVKDYARFENLALISEEAIPPTLGPQQTPF